MVLHGHEEEDAAVQELNAGSGGDSHVQEDAVQHSVGHHRKEGGGEDGETDAHRHHEGTQPLFWRGKMSKVKEQLDFISVATSSIINKIFQIRIKNIYIYLFF